MTDGTRDSEHGDRDPAHEVLSTDFQALEGTHSKERQAHVGLGLDRLPEPVALLAISAKQSMPFKEIPPYRTGDTRNNTTPWVATGAL